MDPPGILKLRRLTSSLGLSCALSLATGCSTSYLPKPGPRVAIIQQAGSPAYVRDGKIYEGGLFGGDLPQAVRGNAEAEAHARAYKSGMVGGFITTLLGGLGMGAGLVVFANGTQASGPATTGAADSSHGQAVGGAMFVGGLAAYVAGFVIMLNAQPHMWDAINVYNDGLPASAAPPPVPPPGVYAPVAPAPPLVPPPSPPPAAPAPPATQAPAAPGPPAAGFETAPRP